jgi:hypothetical protein
MWIEQNGGGRRSPSLTTITEAALLNDITADALRDAQQHYDPQRRQEALTWLWICCPDLATDLDLPTPEADAFVTPDRARLTRHG